MSNSATPTSDSTASADVVENAPAKSWKDALDAAKKSFDGKVDKIELEPRSGGGHEYKIELLSADEKYAVQYDADTLEKISEKTDDLGDDADKKQATTFDESKVVDLDQAADAARERQDGTITKWKIEGKDTGRVQYEFDILPAGASEDEEVQIDATTGRAL